MWWNLAKTITSAGESESRLNAHTDNFLLDFQTRLLIDYCAGGTKFDKIQLHKPRKSGETWCFAWKWKLRKNSFRAAKISGIQKMSVLLNGRRAIH
jgi:hypothetical protein